MLPIRIKACSESDLRMLGNLARNIQRVLPVTQADIDAAAALGKGWVVWKVFEVSDPLDNLRGGTQLIIRQNSIQPGQNVRRVIFVSGPGGQTVVIRGTDYIVLPDAIANSLSYVKAFGGTEQGLPDGYTQLEYIQSTGTQYIDTGLKLTQDNTVEVEYNYHTASNIATSGRMFGARYTSSPRNAFAVGTNTGKVESSTKVFAQFDDIGSTSANNITIDQWNTYKVSSNGFYIDGVRQGAAFSTTAFETPFTVKLFAFEQATSSSGTPSVGCGVGRCRRFKVYQGDTLVMDLIPAKNPTDDIGVYDLIRGQFFANAGTGDFIAGAPVDPVLPTPDAPMDIVSNNGVLKARHQSGLPWDYTLLEYIQSTGTQYIDTGLKLTQDNTVEVEYNYHIVSSIATSGRMFGARYTSSPKRAFSVGSDNGYASSANRVFGQFGDSSRTALNNIVIGQWDVYKLSVDGLYVDGVLQGSFPATTFETPFTVKLFAFEQASSSSGTPSVGCGVGRCRRFKVYQEDALVMDLIPAKNPTDDIGMYDLVSGLFFANQGTGDFVAGATVDDIEVYADGTVETIKDSLNNTATAEMLLKVGDYQDVQSILDGTVTRKVGVKVLDGTENWIEFSSNAIIRNAAANWGAIAGLGGFCTHLTVLKSGETTFAGSCRFATDFNVYDYKTAFGVNNITRFKQYLAEQYAAGTPVILLYPLATPTTESVAGQTLQVTDGDNVLEITQASLDGLELEAQYNAAVSLTIQEVQDANLDNNVTVTIQ